MASELPDIPPDMRKVCRRLDLWRSAPRSETDATAPEIAFSHSLQKPPRGTFAPVQISDSAV